MTYFNKRLTSQSMTLARQRVQQPVLCPHCMACLQQGSACHVRHVRMIMMQRHTRVYRSSLPKPTHRHSS